MTITMGRKASLNVGHVTLCNRQDSQNELP